MKNEKNLHEGHRSRLKNRFLESGLDSFEPHNILELLLFYSIPRKDTNGVAHELIERFGSLSGVFDASVENLIKVDYITENSAALIKMIPAISRAYLVDKMTSTKKFDNVETLKEYLLRLFYGEKNECVYVLFLTNGFELISAEKLHEGSVNSTHLSTRKLLEQVIKTNASMIILAHNHPKGAVVPSMEDIETTSKIHEMLKTINVDLVEHFIVNEFECYPLIHETSALKSVFDKNKNLFNTFEK